MMSFYYVILVT